MTPQEMKSRSGEKVKQVMDLAQSLSLKIEARQRINQEGFIEMTVFFTDSENYPSIAPEGATAEAPVQEESAAEPSQQEVAPTGETGA